MRIALASVFSLFVLPAMLRAQPLLIDEWGTFTSYQDESGRAIPGINTDDEPVPDFVHRILPLIQPTTQSGKGIPPNNPDVTMRLETPVIYFHFPQGAPPQPFDVSVAFQSGWLTEFFPQADAQAPGLTSTAISPLTPDTIGTLTWRGVHAGAGEPFPQSSDPVWTSPRNVQCNPISVGNESEKFLFYRGVAHLDSPLRVIRDSTGNLQIQDQYEIPNHEATLFRFPPIAWLVDVRQDGTIAWRRATPLNTSLVIPLTISSQFSPSEYNTLDSLHKEMSRAITAQGLFSDEAEALLNTWQQSYFKNPGLRLFFLVDPTWTNQVLPLHVSVRSQITRVMIGRIELVTPDQRELIHQIESSPSLAPQAFAHLGRFRNALLLDEQVHHPSPALAQFLQTIGLQPYESSPCPIPSNH